MKLIRASLPAAAVALAFAVTPVTAKTNVELSLNIGPPPPPVVVVPPPPRVGFIWSPPYWEWREHKHRWHEGRWVRERDGWRWDPPHWEERHGRWFFVPGHWVRD
jgi:hypothetical protein